MTRHRGGARPRRLVTLCALVLAGCSVGDGEQTATMDATTDSSTASDPAADTSGAVTTIDVPPDDEPDEPGATVGPPLEQVALVRLPDAFSINVADAPDGPVVVWTDDGHVNGATLDVQSGGLGPPWQVPGNIAPFPHPIERPAVMVDAAGRIHVAYTTLVGDGGSVAHSAGDGTTFSEPRIVSGPPRAETVLVHVTDSPDREPLLAYLEDSTLSVASVDDAGAWRETELIDEFTCDCCNPVPIFVGEADEVVVAYRDQQRAGGAVIRDVAMTRSVDGGATFSDGAVIADDHWYLDACPFSGPDVVEIGGELVVAWADGRQTVHPGQDGVTIWIDRSADGGASFGTDLALTSAGIHRWPVMAVDGRNTLHLVWETQDPEHGGISYASSTDGGRTFTEPRLLVPASPETGRPRTPSIAVSGDHLVITWITSTPGAMIGTFLLSDL